MTKHVLDERLVQAARDLAGGCLCCETGAICEAHKRGERVVATVCVGRDDEQHAFEILAPCGLCMDRGQQPPTFDLPDNR